MSPRLVFSALDPRHVVSAVFLAAGGSAVLLGVTRQLVGCRWAGATGFRYVGSIGPLEIDRGLRRQFQRIGDCLADAFDMCGLFGIDAIVSGTDVWTIEVNPRLTASVEILERATGLAAIGHASGRVSRSAIASPQRWTWRPLAWEGRHQRGPGLHCGCGLLPAPGDFSTARPIWTIRRSAPDRRPDSCGATGSDVFCTRAEPQVQCIASCVLRRASLVSCWTRGAGWKTRRSQRPVPRQLRSRNRAARKWHERRGARGRLDAAKGAEGAVDGNHRTRNEGGRIADQPQQCTQQIVGSAVTLAGV